MIAVSSNAQPVCNPKEDFAFSRNICSALEVSNSMNVSGFSNIRWLFGDGNNHCYGIKYWCTIEKLDFSIYNRWGERIFQTSNPNACWDGTWKGEKLDPAVFVYVIKAVTICGDAYRKGTFSLIR